MGAFKIEVMLHDTELEEFIRQAFADELTPEAEYVARRIVDEMPELGVAHPDYRDEGRP